MSEGSFEFYWYLFNTWRHQPWADLCLSITQKGLSLEGKPVSLNRDRSLPVPDTFCPLVRLRAGLWVPWSLVFHPSHEIATHRCARTSVTSRWTQRLLSPAFLQWAWGSHGNAPCRPPIMEGVSEQEYQLLCSEIYCHICAEITPPVAASGQWLSLAGILRQTHSWGKWDVSDEWLGLKESLKTLSSLPWRARRFRMLLWNVFSLSTPWGCTGITVCQLSKYSLSQKDFPNHFLQI